MTPLILLPLAYIIAAPLTALISLNPLATHWADPWTYAWWAGATCLVWAALWLASTVAGVIYDQD